MFQREWCRAAWELHILTVSRTAAHCRNGKDLTWKSQANVLAGVIELSIACVQQYTPNAVASDTCKSGQLT